METKKLTLVQLSQTISEKEKELKIVKQKMLVIRKEIKNLKQNLVESTMNSLMGDSEIYNWGNSPGTVNAQVKLAKLESDFSQESKK